VGVPEGRAVESGIGAEAIGEAGAVMVGLAMLAGDRLGRARAGPAGLPVLA